MNWIVCLKHGTKYSSEYVNKLFNMTKRNSSVPFSFACITENPTGLDSNIKVIPIPKFKLEGWWIKPWVFSPDFPLDGTILFLDLDLVVIKNIDELWLYSPNKFCIIRDFTRSTVKEWNKFNSSVFRFEKGSFSYVWENLIADTSQTTKMHGDQDWIFKQITDNFAFWPDEWMQSYKWEIRNKNDVVRDSNGKRVFKHIANPVIGSKTKILVFHGEPKPDQVLDPVVVQNWK